MNAEAIYTKTDKGQQEIASRSGELTPLQRRLLILVDGKRSAEAIGRALRADDYVEILDGLRRAGFIKAARAAPPPARPSAAAAEAPRRETFANVEAQEFMLNTLKTFAHSVRNQELFRQISNAASQEELRLQMESWYDAIAENPDGAARVDELRSELLKMFMKGGA